MIKKNELQHMGQIHERQNRKHLKEIESKIPQVRDKQIYNEFPQDKILDTDSAVKTLKSKTGLKDQEIAESLNRLIQDHKIITANGIKSNKMYLRRNLYTK